MPAGRSKRYERSGCCKLCRASYSNGPESTTAKMLTDEATGILTSCLKTQNLTPAPNLIWCDCSSPPTLSTELTALLATIRL